MTAQRAGLKELSGGNTSVESTLGFEYSLCAEKD
jgi:hypothetical protein